jgi:hypothetical protein
MTLLERKCKFIVCYVDQHACDMHVTCRWNFTVGNMELMLIEGEEKEERGQSCSMFEDLDWEVHVDTMLGRLYSTSK